MNSHFKATVILMVKRSQFLLWSLIEFEYNTVAPKLWFCLDGKAMIITAYCETKLVKLTLLCDVGQSN